MNFNIKIWKIGIILNERIKNRNNINNNNNELQNNINDLKIY